jgi:hypothetical protein
VKRANTSSRAAVASAVPSPSNGGRFVSIKDARPANDVGDSPGHSEQSKAVQAAATERFLRLVARCIAREILADAAARCAAADRLLAGPARAKK